ncbi:MAG: T9SS type A sorting domain-containing protein [Candidatus Eisenbacteria bacterium]|uniref:T9SS type A sorting domain-containing protein n=1 Tax=Eiseniibacteriota bacterium TaxID=2212470 RepID=A0A956LZN7_UNCEI|nr:T9SS type A sorting domain-containing protein [Candidatus Eisenbacteria bacterium]
MKSLWLAAWAATMGWVGVAGPAWAFQGAEPLSWSLGWNDANQVDTVILPAVDEAAYLAEDAARASSGEATPLRFAAPLYVHYSPASDGSWTALPDGRRVWRMQLVSLGARTLNLGFSEVTLPPGATVHIYSADPSWEYYEGPFSASEVIDGQIWTPVVPGDAVMVEMMVPAHSAFEPGLAITQVNHDYRGFGSFDAPAGEQRQGSCNNDVVCPEANPWRDDIRSEGVYTLQGFWTCSGQLINTIGVTPPPAYFLTANHCGISTGNDNTMVVYWNFESPNCGSLCCGSLSDNQTGALYRASYSTSDFCLVELSLYPRTSSDVYFAGWDARQENAPTSAVGIHHPNCDEKAISFQNDPLTITTYLQNSVPGNGSHWRIDQWEDGTTEPGSSGSGLWDPNHHLVGQLHGGFASCSSITSDWYGRLPVSWTGGGGNSTRLSNWLDPNGTGTLMANGRNPDDPGSVEDGPLGVGFATQVAPNPTSTGFRVTFRMQDTASVQLEIVDAAGRVIQRHQAGTYGPGEWQVAWPTAGARALDPGVYFVRVVGQDTAQKLVVVR